jgi:RNA polymerase sigma-70 factor (ECF subfamily)
LLDATSGLALGDPYPAPAPVRPFAMEVGADPGKLRIAYSLRTPDGSLGHPDCLSALEDAVQLCAALPTLQSQAGVVSLHTLAGGFVCGRRVPLARPMSAGDTGGEDEAALVAALRRGDEQAFEWLVQQHHTRLVRLALRYVRTPEVAEEVAQETWLHVLKGLSRFEFRSSLRTWISSILVNRARTRARRERPSLPFSDAWAASLAGGEPAVDPDRFVPSDSPDNPDRWVSAPRPWLPEDRVLSGEARTLIFDAILALPIGQREVITLRDVEGHSADEVCTLLGLTGTNQRVLLHRARSRVRAALERYLTDQS